MIPVVVVAEHERRAADGDRAVGAAGEELPGVDDVDRAEAEALVDVGLLAQRGGGEHLDGVAPVGALRELLGRPHRPGVIGLARFIHVRPLELGLGRGGPDEPDRQKCRPRRPEQGAPIDPDIHEHDSSLARQDACD
jgi:hypothetical protein